MGSPVSPIVANLYMKYFEQKLLIMPLIPKLWLRYVDDTFIIQKEENKQNILEHINSGDLAITFTVEDKLELLHKK